MFWEQSIQFFLSSYQYSTKTVEEDENGTIMLQVSALLPSSFSVTRMQRVSWNKLVIRLCLLPYIDCQL